MDAILWKVFVILLCHEVVCNYYIHFVYKFKVFPKSLKAKFKSWIEIRESDNNQ